MIEVPNPANSPNEKWQPTRWGVDPRTDRLRELLIREGVEEGLALGFSMAMEEAMRHRSFSKREVLEYFSRWANIHTHDGLITPEPEYTHILVCGGEHSTGSTTSVNALELSTGTWTALSPMPNTKSMHGLALYNDLFYVWGGQSTPLANYSYDPVTDAWVSLTSMLRTHPTLNQGGVAMASGKLFWLLGDSQPHVDVYDIGTDTPSSLTNGPATFQLPNACANTDGTKIYLFGGYSGGGTSGIYEYTVATDTWTLLGTTLSVARWSASATLIDGLIYIAGGRPGGGFSTIDSLEVFDPSTNSISSLTAMPTATQGHAACEFNGALHTLGGFDTAGTRLALHQIYDPSTDTWSTGVPLGAVRGYAAAHPVTL